MISCSSRQRLLGVLAGEEVEVGPTDGERRAGHAKPRGRIPVDARESTLEVLEVDGVGDVVHQRLEQEERVFELQNVLDGLARELGADRGRASSQSHGRLAPTPSCTTFVLL